MVGEELSGELYKRCEHNVMSLYRIAQDRGFEIAFYASNGRILSHNSGMAIIRGIENFEDYAHVEIIFHGKAFPLQEPIRFVTTTDDNMSIQGLNTGVQPDKVCYSYKSGGYKFCSDMTE